MSNLPAGWESIALGSVVKNARETAKTEPDGQYLLYSIPAFEQQTPEVVRGYELGSSKLLTKPEDVLVSKINPRINRVWCVPSHTEMTELLCSPEWLVCRVVDRGRLNPSFLTYYLSSPEFRDWIVGAVSGVTGSHTRAKAEQILQQSIPLPPLDEQRRIVEILDDHFSRLDVMERLIGTQIRTLGAIRRRVFDDCAGSGTGDRSRWEDRRFGEIATIDADLRDPAGYLDLPHIAPNHIEKDTGRLLEFATVAADGVTSAKQYFRDGQILYSKIRPYLNKVVLVDFEGLCSADMYPISTSQNVRWLHFMMLSPTFVRATSGNQNRTVLPKINASTLRQIPVRVPPLEVQQALVEKTAKTLEAVERVEDSMAVVTRRVAALRRAILHAAFNGQLTKEFRND